MHTNKRLPANFSKILQYGTEDLPVFQLGTLEERTGLLRTFTKPSSGPDYVLYIREGDEVILWRVSPKGRTVLTVLAVKGKPFVVVPNARFASKLVDLCDFFTTLDDFPKTKGQR